MQYYLAPLKMITSGREAYPTSSTRRRPPWSKLITGAQKVSGGRRGKSVRARVQIMRSPTIEKTPYALQKVKIRTTMKRQPTSVHALGPRRLKNTNPSPTCGCCVLPTKRRLATLQLSTQHYRRARASSGRQFRWVETSPTRP